MELSSQEIERRRANANSLVAEGRLGGAKYGRLGGRPKVPRAAERVAERVAGEADSIFERLKEIIETGGEANAINSIKTLLQIEENERQIQENEELKFEQLKRDELIKYIAGTLGELQSSGIFPGGTIDAEFEPVEYPAIEGYGSSDKATSEPN
jgi:hypothetical protein